MTNAEKFREVFGFTPNLFENRADTFPCLAPLKVCKMNMNKCNGCPFLGWWGKEYKACFEIREEFEEPGKRNMNLEPEEVNRIIDELEKRHGIQRVEAMKFFVMAQTVEKAGGYWEWVNSIIYPKPAIEGVE